MKAQQRSKTLWLLLSSSALSLVILFLSQGKVFTHPLSFPLRVGIACSMVTGSLVAWALSGRRIFPWGAGLSGLIFISILTVNLAPPTLPARAAPAALRISGIQANASSVGLYEKFELTFSVEGSVATNPYFPYDPSPPNGVPARVGITVEGLFTPDNWQTVLIQPGFLYQAYERRCIFDGRPVDPCPPNGEEWLYPQGNPVWKVRFAPQQLGTWRYRLRVTDASGTVESQEGTFVPQLCHTTMASFALASATRATLNTLTARRLSALATGRGSAAGALPMTPMIPCGVWSVGG